MYTLNLDAQGKVTFENRAVLTPGGADGQFRVTNAAETHYGTLLVSGEYVSHIVGPNTQVLDNTSIPLGDLFGLVFMQVQEDGALLQFFLRGGFTSTEKVYDGLNVGSTTQGTANKINVYWDAASSVYRLENKRGGSRYIRIYMIG